MIEFRVNYTAKVNANGTLLDAKGFIDVLAMSKRDARQFSKAALKEQGKFNVRLQGVNVKPKSKVNEN